MKLQYLHDIHFDTREDNHEEYLYLYYFWHIKIRTHIHTRTPSVRIKTDHHRVLVHFYDVILIYIDTPAAGNRGALLKLNGTSFGGCEIFDTGQIVLSSFILASPVIGASGYRILRIIILPGVALSANQLLRNPELFPNYPAIVIVHREH